MWTLWLLAAVVWSSEALFLLSEFLFFVYTVPQLKAVDYFLTLSLSPLCSSADRSVQCAVGGDDRDGSLCLQTSTPTITKRAEWHRNATPATAQRSGIPWFHSCCTPTNSLQPHQDCNLTQYSQTHSRAILFPFRARPHQPRKLTHLTNCRACPLCVKHMRFVCVMSLDFRKALLNLDLDVNST